MGVSNIDKGLKKREREVCRFGVRLFSMLIRRWTHSYIRLIALSLGFLVVVFFCMKAILSNLLCLLFKNKKKMTIMFIHTTSISYRKGNLKNDQEKLQFSKQQQ